MTNLSVPYAPTASAQARRARWIGYTAAIWALLFALMHLNWGIEAATTGTLSVIGKTITVPRGDSFAWVLYAGILCILAVIVALLRFWSERMPRPMRLSAIGVGCVALTAYVAYTVTINGFMWLLAPGVLCAAGAVIALALIQPWGRVIPHWLLLLLAWIGGAILIVHTLSGMLIQILATLGVITWRQAQIAIGAPVAQTPTAQEGIRSTLMNLLTWDPWFLLGGVLFCVLAGLARHRRDERLMSQPSQPAQ